MIEALGEEDKGAQWCRKVCVVARRGQYALAISGALGTINLAYALPILLASGHINS